MITLEKYNNKSSVYKYIISLINKNKKNNHNLSVHDNGR